LADRALRVAAALVSVGVGVGDVVGVTVRRGPEQVAAVLGVLAAGGVYVPVGVDQPVVRRERIFAAAGVRCVVTGASVVALGWSGDVVVLERAWSVAPLASPVVVGGDELAYVIYTSGSTGEPKGVEVSHRSALNTVVDVNERFGVGGSDRVLALSSLDFDLSVYDVFGLLSVGGSVVVVGEEERQEAQWWVRAVGRWSVTVWNSVPALLDMALVAGADRPGWADGLRLVLVSGDWVGLDLPDRLRGQCAGGRLVALGGATEAAIWSNAFEVESVAAHWRSVPYGFPLRNQSFRVVDGRGRDCPDWVAGELWIGGVGVARGYRGDPERTAARFVTVDGTRWYRTGDMGRYWPDGTLEFLGRRDFQVKLGGHRIELGEIEAALSTHPAVSRAVAVVTGQRRLAALVVTDPATTIDPDTLRQLCTQRLPTYMVPDRILTTDTLPLTANGKIDRATIDTLLTTTTTQPGQPPTGPIETTLATIWTHLLHTNHIHRDDNFFTLGGDSLLATQLVAAVRHEFGAALSLRLLLGLPTLAELSAWVQAELATASTVEEGVV
jgi:amino acid adenylation domain-containing protein